MSLRTLIVIAVTALLLALGIVPAWALVSSAPTNTFPSFDNTVRSVVHRGNTIYVGGDFTSVTDASTTYVRRGAAAIDATTGLVLPWNPRVVGSVHRILATNRGVYLGGDFAKVHGHVRHDLAMVNGVDAKLGRLHPRLNGEVNAIAVSKRRVYVGGDFTSVNGHARKRLAAFKRSSSALTGWLPRAVNGKVYDLVRRKKNVYVAGDFRTLDGRDAFERLALVKGSTGALVRSFNPDSSRTLFDIQVRGGSVYAAEGGLRGGGAQAYSRTDGATLWARRFDGDVQAITVMNGTAYAGGHFNAICDDSVQDQNGTCVNGSTARLRGASLDAASGVLTGWDPRMNGSLGIETFSTYASLDRLLTGGDFTTADTGSIPVSRFAVFDGP